MRENDVTELVNFSEFDVGLLGLNNCLCGAEYHYGDFIITDDKTRLVGCKKCGREFFFSKEIRVYEVK
jgi:hypothetical protein